jgi:hypothetical protein
MAQDILFCSLKTQLGDFSKGIKKEDAKKKKGQ